MTDSVTLFKQARLEMKAAAAYFEAAQSAHRYTLELRTNRELVYNNLYNKTLALGVPVRIARLAAQQASEELLREALEANEEGLAANEMATQHRARGEALLIRHHKARISERLAKEN